MTLDLAGLERVLDALPQRFKGPAGVAGVVHEGRVIARRAWGFADLATRQAMTAQTLLPICSITKQFTCALLLDQIGDPAALDAKVRAFLPDFSDPLPTVRQLCDNQSGLRDYWALTVLHGAAPEGLFRREDAAPLIARMKTGHFPAGAAYSYCNCNYRILSDMIEAETGRDLGDLYAERVFAPAGMATARLLPDTRVNADGVVGYEGNDEVGFLPAVNGIHWRGDAGISASLDDMLAWEAFIDATRDDEGGLYRRLTVPARYGDGTPASYGYGLRHDVVAGVKTTGHGGALRGFRAHRLHAASERLSVVVMFNHEAAASAATATLMEAALGYQSSVAPAVPVGWDGIWLDEANGLLVRTVQDSGGVMLRYAPSPARLTVAADGVARGGGVTLTRGDEGLTMLRPAENMVVRARALVPGGTTISGRFWCDEVQASLLIEARDGALFAGFDGMLGQGPMERMYPVSEGLWVITSRRSMDAAAPGDWTVLALPDGGLQVGCWLARGLRYRPL
jgi:D-aminopeptidase